MIRKTGDKGTFYSGEKGTKKIGVDNIRTGKPDVSIDLVDGGTVYTITPNVEVKDLSEGVVQWLEIGRKSKFILRRYMLLDFIDAAPASRYSALEPFLDLEPYLGIEEALHQWKGDLDTKIAFISSKLESVKDRIMVTFKLGEAKALKADELLRCLNTKLLEVGLSTCLCLDKLKETKDQINIALGGKDVTNRIQKIEMAQKQKIFQ